MIVSCRDKETELLVKKIPSRRYRSIEKQAYKKLDLLRAATSLRDRGIPGLHLKGLHGDRKGQHSIRVNDQYLICFEWREDGAHDVEFTDYH